MVIAGMLCRLNERFVLELTGEAVTGSMHLTPVSLFAGASTGELSGHGFSASGGLNAWGQPASCGDHVRGTWRGLRDWRGCQQLRPGCFLGEDDPAQGRRLRSRE